MDESLTAMALHLYREFSTMHLDAVHIKNNYLNGIGDYERRIAKENDIDIPDSKWD